MHLEYYITTDIKGYKILWRANDEQERHAHLRDMRSVRTLLCLIGKNLLPKDKYYNRGGRKVEKR